MKKEEEAKEKKKKRSGRYAAMACVSFLPLVLAWTLLNPLPSLSAPLLSSLFLLSAWSVLLFTGAETGCFAFSQSALLLSLLLQLSQCVGHSLPSSLLPYTLEQWCEMECLKNSQEHTAHTRGEILCVTCYFVHSEHINWRVMMNYCISHHERGGEREREEKREKRSEETRLERRRNSLRLQHTKWRLCVYNENNCNCLKNW